MQTFNLIIAALGVIAAIYFLIKKYDTKLVLLTAGLGMAIAGLKPISALDAFAKSMTNPGLIQAICSVLGFAAVLKLTGCDKHLVALLSKPLKKAGFLVIPTAILLTFTINIALPSAAGCAAAVGAVFIPLLINSGVRPATAAAAVFAGTYGSMLSPGISHNPFVADIATKVYGSEFTVIQVIQTHAFATVVSILVATTVITIVSIMKKEHTGYVSEDKDFQVEEGMKVNILYALINVIPLAILVFAFTSFAPESFKSIKVPHAMIIGAILAILVTRKSPTEVCKGFFNGMGGAYADVIGIIIAAGVFVAGLNALGAVDAFIDVLKTHPEWASAGGTFGPFLLAIVTGSGDAAAMAFNGAVTPHALDLGTTPEKLGTLTAVAGAIGRTMSPLAGAVIVCAGIAKVTTMEVARRTAPGMICAVIVLFVILGVLG